MYPEFIAIYVMLGIVILMLGAVLFFLIKLMKRSGANSNNYYMPNYQANDNYYGGQYREQYPQQQYSQQGGGVVFCRQCASQFDSSQAYCPHCGARRQ